MIDYAPLDLSPSNGREVPRKAGATLFKKGRRAQKPRQKPVEEASVEASASESESDSDAAPPPASAPPRRRTRRARHPRAKTPEPRAETRVQKRADVHETCRIDNRVLQPYGSVQLDRTLGYVAVGCLFTLNVLLLILIVVLVLKLK